jgi:hypothetical protein
MSKKATPPEIRIQNLPVQLHEDLHNIAANSGVSVQDLLKPKLREIANGYSETMKLPPRED